MPFTQIFQDTFTRADSTQGNPGNNWLDIGGRYLIDTNRLRCNSQGSVNPAFRPASGTGSEGLLLNSKRSVTFVQDPNGIYYVATRRQTTGEWYGFVVSTSFGGICKFVRFNAAQSSTDITGSFSGSAITGLVTGQQYTLELEATGTSPTSLVARVLDVANGNTVFRSGTATDSTSQLQAAGVGGLASLNGTTLYYTQYSDFQESTVLAAGTVSFNSATGNTISLTSTAATAGTAPYTYQWHRSTTSGFTPGVGTAISGATSLTLNDSGLTPETLYYYKLVVTDSAAATAITTEFAAYTATPIFVGFVGDSIFTSTYNIPSLTQTLLQTQDVPGSGTRSVTTNTQAIGGTNSSQWVQGQSNYTTAIAALNTASSSFAAGYKFVVLMLGTNDARSDTSTSNTTYLSNLQSTINGLIVNGYKVVVNSPPYVGSAASATSTGLLTQAAGNPIIKGFHKQIAKLINQKTVFTGDSGAIFNAFSQADATFLGDGIHPSVTGQYVFAGNIASAITRAAFGKQARSPRMFEF